jgi:outer membrane protein TolC
MKIRFTFIACLILFVFISNKINAQLGFADLFEKAKIQNTELVSLEASKAILELEASRIKAENISPKAYLSSELLFAPYFNNNGEIISTNPQNSAIGYDVGVTNGGLYSFLFNTEIPVFNHKQVNNLLEQNTLEISKIDSRINAMSVELKHALALQYLDVFSSQVEFQNLQENLILLKKQLVVARSLTEHGLFRYVDYRLLQTACTSDSINLENSEAAFRLKLNQMKAICGITDTSTIQINGFEPVLNQELKDSSIFIQSYIQDSLSAVIQQKVFENQYKPQVKVYANTGLNSTSIPYMGNHIGMSAGVQLTYTLFDGRQKEINRQQQLVLMNQASREKEIKQFEVQNQKASYFNAIQSLNSSIGKEEKLQKDYEQILSIYNDELQNAQVGIIDYLNFLQLFNQNKLTLENHKIERSKLIVEYNYWNN